MRRKRQFRKVAAGFRLAGKSSFGIGSMTAFSIPQRRKYKASISSGAAADAPVKTT